MKALSKQQEGRHLFQFLNGLDDEYNAQRSQILLMNPLPSVEAVCAMLHQEEIKRRIRVSPKSESEPTALYNRNPEEKCTKYGEVLTGYMIPRLAS